MSEEQSRASLDQSVLAGSAGTHVLMRDLAAICVHGRQLPQTILSPPFAAESVSQFHKSTAQSPDVSGLVEAAF